MKKCGECSLYEPAQESNGMCHSDPPKLFMIPVASRAIVANDSPSANISIIGARPQIQATDRACRFFNPIPTEVISS